MKKSELKKIIREELLKEQDLFDVAAEIDSMISKEWDKFAKDISSKIKMYKSKVEPGSYEWNKVKSIIRKTLDARDHINTSDIKF